MYGVTFLILNDPFHARGGTIVQFHYISLDLLFGASIASPASSLRSSGLSVSISKSNIKVIIWLNSWYINVMVIKCNSI